MVTQSQDGDGHLLGATIRISSPEPVLTVLKLQFDRDQQWRGAYARGAGIGTNVPLRPESYRRQLCRFGKWIG